MATPSPQLEVASVREQALEVCRELLAELGNPRGLQAVRGDAHLDRDLGLGSLERVELMLRLDSAFGVHLADQVVAEADTLEDLIAAVSTALLNAGAAPPASGRVETSSCGEPRTAPRSTVVPPVPAGGAPRGTAASEATGTHPAARGVESAATLQEVLRYRAHVDASRPHLYFPDDTSLGLGLRGARGAARQEDSPEPVTFGQLYARAAAVAAELARRGIAPGHTVAIMLTTSPEFFYAFAGVLLAGAIPVPIYPPFRADRIAEYAARQSAILSNAEARLLITFRQAETVARLLLPQVPSLTGVVSAARLVEPSARDQRACGAARRDSAASQSARSPRPRGDDIALLQYTSGSTGDPKGVVLTHANLLANIRAIGEAVAVRSDDVAVSWLPLYHDMGLIGAWLLPLYFGIPLAVISPLAFLTRPERWLWAFHHLRGSLSAAPNFAYELCARKIADKHLEGLDLSTWRAALNGAEPVNPQTIERFAGRFARYGFRREAMLPVYGLAEASLAVTIPPLGRLPLVDCVERAAFEREGRAVPVLPETPPDDPGVISFVSAGRPVPRHEVRVVDAAGHDVGERVEGALWFRGPSATRGYYRHAAATQALFPEGVDAGWVDTGDRAYSAGGEIYVTGRVKDIIIKAGRNLYPHEVEELTGRVPGARKGCVVAFGLRDAASGTERLVVVAETREKNSARRARIAHAITEELNAALGLPPDVVELVAPHSIPKTSSGKLRREETRRLYSAGTLRDPRPPAWLQVARLAVGSGARGLVRVSRRALELAFGLYALVMFGLWIVPVWLLVLLAPTRRAAARITSRALRLYMALVGCRIRVRGREYLRGRAARIFVANHASFSDVLVLMAALGVDYRFVAKIEVSSMPFIRTFMRKLGHIAFDRGDPQARLRQAAQIERFLRRGESVFVFPEGTFAAQAGVRPFQLGAFKAAVATGRPICPVALRGTRQFLRDKTRLPRPASVTLTLCPLLDPAPATVPFDWHEIVRLRDAARAAIAQHCGEPLL